MAWKRTTREELGLTKRTELEGPKAVYWQNVADPTLIGIQMSPQVTYAIKHRVNEAGVAENIGGSVGISELISRQKSPSADEQSPTAELDPKAGCC